MKKILVIFLSLILMPFTLALPKNEVLAKDSDTLVIYSWEDYLDLGYEEEDLEDEFFTNILDEDDISDEEILKDLDEE